VAAWVAWAIWVCDRTQRRNDRRGPIHSGLCFCVVRAPHGGTAWMVPRHGMSAKMPVPVASRSRKIGYKIFKRPGDRCGSSFRHANLLQHRAGCGRPRSARQAQSLEGKQEKPQHTAKKLSSSRRNTQATGSPSSSNERTVAGHSAADGRATGVWPVRRR